MTHRALELPDRVGVVSQRAQRVATETVQMTDPRVELDLLRFGKARLILRFAA